MHVPNDVHTPPEWSLDAVHVLLAEMSQRPAGSVPVLRAGLSTGCCFGPAQLQAVPAPRFAADRHTLHSHNPAQSSAQRFHVVSNTAACVMCHGTAAMGLMLSMCSGQWRLGQRAWVVVANNGKNKSMADTMFAQAVKRHITLTLGWETDMMQPARG